MQPEMARSAQREMAILGLVEFALSFTVIYCMVRTAGGGPSLPAMIASLSGDRIKLAGFSTLMIGVVALTIGLYRPEVCFNRKRLMIAVSVSAAVAFAILLLLGGGLRHGFTAAHVTDVARILGCWLLTISLIRLLFNFTLARASLSRRVLIVGHPRQIAGFSARLLSRRGQRFEPVVVHAQDVCWPMLCQGRIWAIVVASAPEALALDPLLDCKLRGARVLSGAAFHEHHLGRVDLDTLTVNDLLTGNGFASSRLSDVLKRLSDVCISVAMIIVTLPLMVLTALAIKADSAGPVFYRQQRIGAFDKPFIVFKFRSMTADAEACGKPRWAQKHDARVTRVGRFIRATRIDELPQLANVIRGEMSLVGPRPERPLFVEQLAQAIPFYRQRSYVKPGLTGWAQVNYPYGASVEDAREKLAYDLYYVKKRSLLLDMKILLSTVRVVLFQEGSR